MLHARGITVNRQDRERIASCTDDEQLNSWLVRAITAQSIDEVFE